MTLKLPWTFRTRRRAAGALIATLVTLDLLGTVSPASATSCADFSCQPGCTPGNHCQCEQTSGNDESSASFQGQTVRVENLSSCVGGDYVHRVRVTGIFAGPPVNTRELRVGVYGAVAGQFWANYGAPQCPTTSCVVDTGSLPWPPVFVLVENWQTNSAGTPGAHEWKLIQNACLSPCTGCAACCGKNCNDGIACTADGCNTATGSCTHNANDNLCNDGVSCTNDNCNPNDGCHNNPVNSACNDGDVCTTDTCNAVAGCQHSNAANGTTCNDNKPCTPSSTCENGTCTGAHTCSDGNACTNDVCTTSGCSFPAMTSGTPCNDQNACTGTDTCQGGTCVGSACRIGQNCVAGCANGFCKQSGGVCGCADVPVASWLNEAIEESQR